MVTASAAHEETLPQRSDIARTSLTAEEIREVVEYDCHERGVRFRSDLFENVWATYNAHRRRIMGGGDGTTSTRQLARDLYPDVGDDAQAWERKRYSVQRWLSLLQRQGLISKSELCDARGKSLGLRVELRPVSEVTALTRGCSSAGSSVRVRLKRRRLTSAEACEARVRRWCPRAGRGTPRRFDPPFYAQISVAPIAMGVQALKGRTPIAEEQVGARAREAPDAGSVDAIPPDGEQNAGAALDRRLTAALGAGKSETLRRAEEAFVAVLGPPVAGRLEHLPTIRSLLWALERLDRYGDFGRGRPGAGLDVLEQLLEGQDWSIRREGAVRPRHLGYFVPLLRLRAKRWKHTWAPRLKASRRARRSSPGRAVDGNPRRGRGKSVQAAESSS
jgi:hypothetical protein